MKPSLALLGLACLLLVQGLSSRLGCAEEPRVQFDLPAVAVAHYREEVRGESAKVGDDNVSLAAPAGWKAVNFELRLSCINTSASSLPMEQCTVRVKPRDSSLQIIDYGPRTEVTSELTTAIQIKRSDEKTKSMGLALDGNYGHLAHGNIGSDHGRKTTESVQYDRAAPVQAVIASGTFDRGRGIYFKLRWTNTQVLEGERRFCLTMSVPPTWRGELVDVNVIGEVLHRSVTSWESELKPVAAANFVVATYMHDDPEAAALAYKLAETEYQLRTRASIARQQQSPQTLPEMLRHVAMKMEFDAPLVDTIWISRLLLAQVDPHVDKSILRLPTNLRVIVLDYVDLREEFLALGEPSQETRNAIRSVVAKAERE